MATNIQDNLLHLKEIHVRTELWKDKIYHIPNNPYKFPKNDGSGDFLPRPKRFQQILTEFRKFIDEQKNSERSEGERKEAQQRINEIYLEIKELIQQEIEQEESLGREFELGYQPTEEESQQLIEWEKEKQKTIKNLKLTLKKTTLNQFQKLNREHLQSEGLGTLLTKWEEQRKIVLERKNICFILQDNQDTFQFCYQPPKGNFSALTDFLWYRNNIWYETTNWQRINHENAIITVKRSHFIHNYAQFFSQGANGIFHHYPLTKNKNEICQCPSFVESTNWLDFYSDWQPTYSLWKLDDMKSSNYYGYFNNLKSEKALPFVHTLKLKKLYDPKDFDRNLQQQTLFIMPEKYNGSVFWRDSFKIKFESKQIQKSLKEWAEQKKIGRNSEGEHLLKHCSAQFFWNSKLIYTACLDDLDLEHMEILIRANPSDIMYLFQSNKTFFRWSEDVQFVIDPDIIAEGALDAASSGIQGAISGAVSGAATGSVGGAMGALGGATVGLVGSLFGMAKGERKTLQSQTQQHLHNQIQTFESKSQDEGQTERKTKYAGSLNVVGAVIGSIPAILNPSHTKNDYTLAEFALRFNQLNLSMRVQFNENLLERYHQTKQLKRNCNQVFQTEKAGNYLCAGYHKWVPIIFEGDKGGYFANILGRGVYAYDIHPHEFFTKKLDKQTYENASLRQDASATMTTIEENYKSSIGRDDQVHIDDMSWVWMDSYCRGAGKDLFPQLIEQGREYIKEQDGTPSERVYYKYQITKKEGKEPDWSTKKYHTKEEWDKIVPDTQNDKDLKSWEYDYSRLEYVQEKNNPHYVNKETKQAPTDADKKWYTYDMKQAEGLNIYGVFQNSNESEYNSLPKSYSGLKVGDWWTGYFMTGAGAWKFDGNAKWSGFAKLEPNVKYNWYIHAFSSGQESGATFKGLDDGVEVILRQDGADWELAFKGRVEITETIGNPDAIGSGIEIEDIEEVLPDLEDPKETQGLDNFDKTMEAEPEEQNKNDKEQQEELEEEPEQKKQEEKQDELEEEDEKSNEKQQQKQKQRQGEQQQEDEQQGQPENSREGEK